MELACGHTMLHIQGVSTEASMSVVTLTTIPGRKSEVYRCSDCGRWEDVESGKPIRHSKRCDHANEQPPLIAEKAERNRLWQFARDVKRTGMAQGREEDVLAAVKLGFLTVSDAMNRDD